MGEDRIALEHYRAAIPESDFSKTDFKGVKFQDVYKEFVRLGIKGARNKKKALADLHYYVELGFFGRIQDNYMHKQPIFYQTIIGGDLKTDMYSLGGLKFVKVLLDTKFTEIETEWGKLNKNKLFLKTRKKNELPRPSMKLKKWITLFDNVIFITQNLMWTKETMDYDKLQDDYSKLIKDTIKELNKFAKKVHSTSKENEKYVEAVFTRFPFRITF
jgi:hypothetical protein